jgi:hypothetical protein
MALRKPRPDDMAPPAGGGAATAVAERPDEPAGPTGESAEECAAVGQALVQGGHATAEIIATAITESSGDLLAFTSLLVGG